MSKLFPILIFLLLSTAAAHSQNLNLGSLPSLESLQKSKLGYAVKPNANKTWGYDILMNKKKIIQQHHIPGMSGTQGFKTKAGATAVAKLVVSKIKKGQMPPTVTQQEMKALKAI